MTVGTMCVVASRTWPGINKPGGVGRITHLHYDADSSLSGKVSHVDVLYPVERTRAKRVAVEWVEVKDIINSTVVLGTKGRGGTGRCTRCGSLRRDCGECDWRWEEGREERERIQREEEERRVVELVQRKEEQMAREGGKEKEEKKEKEKRRKSKLRRKRREVSAKQ